MSFLGTSIILFLLDWQFTLVLYLPLVVLVFIVYHFDKRIGPSWEAVREQMGQLTHRAARKYQRRTCGEGFCPGTERKTAVSAAKTSSTARKTWTASAWKPIHSRLWMPWLV